MGGFVEIIPDNLGGGVGGEGDVAGKLAVDAIQDGAGWILAVGVAKIHGVDPGVFHVEQIILPIGEVGDRFIAGLDFGFGEIERTAVEAGGVCRS